MDEKSPRIYRIPQKDFLEAKEQHRVSPGLLGEYNRLRRWSYLPDPSKIAAHTVIHPPMLCLRVAEDCTLGCRYCFNKGNMLNAQKIKLMPKEVGEKAVRFFFSHFKEKIKEKNAEIIFFGGEPLMNFPLIEHLTKYIKGNFKGRKVHFYVVTNGTIMNEDILRWYVKNRLPLHISMDFPKAEHDRNRPFKDGSPSFEKIKENISMAARYLPPGKLFIRAVIAKGSRCALSGIYKSFDRSGIPADHFSADSEFINNLSEKSYVRANAEKVMSQRRSLKEKCRQAFIKAGTFSQVDHQHVCDMHLDTIMEGRTQWQECDVIKSNAISVNPVGEMHFCQVKANIEEFCLGNVDTGIDAVKVEKIMKKYCFEPKECSSCWARGYCPRICPLTRIDKKGREQYCRHEKQVFMDSLDFFLGLNYDQIRNILRASSFFNHRKNHKSIEVILGMYKSINNAHRHIKPVNVMPY